MFIVIAKPFNTEKKIYSYHSRLREIVIASYGYGSGLIVFNSYAVQ
jgi:hypothetical protein